MEQNTTSPSAKRGAVIALAVLIAIIAIGSVAYGFLANASAQQDPQPSRSERSSADPDAIYLEDFDATVYTEDGRPLTLTQIAGNRPLVMNFWATWCPYCVDEMDDYQELYDEFGDRIAFAFIDCVYGERETVRDGSGFLEDNGYTLPAYYDTKQEAAYLFGASSLPTTVVVSVDGEILVNRPGAIDLDTMRSSLESLLAG